MLFSPSSRSRLQLRLSERRLLIMAGDVLCVTTAIFIALFTWSEVADRVFDVEFVVRQIYWFVVLPLLWLLLASSNDFYDLNVASKSSLSLQKLLIITLQLLVLYLLVFFFSPRDALPRLFVIYYGVASFLLIALWRLLNPALIGWAAEPRRILVIGTDEAAQLILEMIREYGSDTYETCGVISLDDSIEEGKTVAGVPIVGTGDDVFNLVLSDEISELIITDMPDVTDGIFRGVMDAYERGVTLTPMPILYERITGRVPVRHVKNNYALVLPLAGQSYLNFYSTAQRMVDLLLGALGFVVFLLTLPLIALVIRLDSAGGIFYTQMRTGLNGKPFRMVKYRTMVQDAEKATGAVFSRKGDPRITRVGNFMRKTRLDELPQMLNVLRGEMSVVGPRPERPQHIRRLTEKIPFYRTRLVVRPGLTGWAQVQYAYGSDDEDALAKLEYDLYYIRNRSLVLDFNIMIRTVGKVLKMSGV